MSRSVCWDNSVGSTMILENPLPIESDQTVKLRRQPESAFWGHATDERSGVAHRQL